MLFVVSISWEEEQEEWYWRAVDVLALFWSDFLQVTVRCRCPACSYSLYLFYLFAVSAL